MIFDFSQFGLPVLIIIFLICAGVIAFVGTKLTLVAERIAEKTGLGQAITGAVFIGISTSLAGTIVTFYSASQGFASLALANSLGGLPAQTAFLALADMAYRRANIEHASASVENLAQTAMLFILISLPVLAFAGPQVSFWGIHPVTPLSICAYLAGLHMINKIKKEPMWHPQNTGDTQQETKSITKVMEGKNQYLYLRFIILALILGLTGYFLAKSAIAIADQTPLSESLIGGVFTSISTSLPELVTTLAAVRRKALNLAVGNIIGGNSFDVLFIAGADIFYREGSIYHEIQNSHIILIAGSILMTGILLLGLIRRERQGPGGIGFETVLILCVYFVLIAMISTA